MSAMAGKSTIAATPALDFEWPLRLRVHAVNTTLLSIGELARRCDLSTHTLRYYESEGVLRPALRASNGHRRYREEDVQWLAFVLRLKQTGMPLQEIRVYAGLREQGDSTLEQRLAVLSEHRERLARQLDALSANATALDAKLELYRQQIASRPSNPSRK